MFDSARSRRSKFLALTVAAVFAAGAAQARDQRNGTSSKPPTCNAGPNQTVDCSGVTTSIALDGTGSTNPLPGALTYHWEHCANPNVFFDDSSSPTPTLYVDLAGACQVVCPITLVVHNTGGQSQCTMTVTLRDVTPPTIFCPADVTVLSTDPTDPSHTGIATATDACNPAPTVSFSDDLSQLPAAILRTWTADDQCQTSSCVQTITIEHPGPHMDIKPGQCPNNIYIGVHDFDALARIPVALLGNDFDVTQTDTSNLSIVRIGLLTGGGQVGPYEFAFEDVGTPFEGDPCDCNTLGPDGVLDIIMYFTKEEFVNNLELDQAPNGAVIELQLNGFLLDQTPFSATNCVTIINPGF
jgi:hypothetical protein